MKKIGKKLPEQAEETKKEVQEKLIEKRHSKTLLLSSIERVKEELDSVNKEIAILELFPYKPGDRVILKEKDKEVDGYIDISPHSIDTYLFGYQLVYYPIRKDGEKSGKYRILYDAKNIVRYADEKR